MFEQLIIICQHDDKLHQMLKYRIYEELQSVQDCAKVSNRQNYDCLIEKGRRGERRMKLPASSIAFSKSALTMDPFSGSRVLPAVPIPEN